MAVITNKTKSMTTVNQACWEVLKMMRESDKELYRKGRLQTYHTEAMEWLTDAGKIETWVHYHTRYYRVYWGYAGKNKDFLEIVTTDADLDARIREEKIDEILE